MKLIISEEQLKSLMSESYDDDRLNYLLDKINAMGLSSLTDGEKESLDKLSKGEETEKPQFDKSMSPEYLDRADDENQSDLLSMFMYFAPEFGEVRALDLTWQVEIVQSNDDEQHLHVANEKTDFYLTPFWENSNSITVEFNNGKSKKLTLKNIPSNEKEMKKFVKLFYSEILPEIIEKIS